MPRRSVQASSGEDATTRSSRRWPDHDCPRAMHNRAIKAKAYSGSSWIALSGRRWPRRISSAGDKRRAFGPGARDVRLEFERVKSAMASSIGVTDSPCRSTQRCHCFAFDGRAQVGDGLVMATLLAVNGAAIRVTSSSSGLRRRVACRQNPFVIVRQPEDGPALRVNPA